MLVIHLCFAVYFKLSSVEASDVWAASLPWPLLLPGKSLLGARRGSIEGFAFPQLVLAKELYAVRVYSMREDQEG